jgi:hypothetical protein
MLSLETPQPAVLSNSFKSFFISDLGNKMFNISFIFRGLIPLSMGMGL